MYKRNIKSHLIKSLGRSPVVLVTGARQVGKTTLTKELIHECNYNYVTLDDEIAYLAAKNDSVGFINGLKKPLIIDEIQRIPELFLAIKIDVDTNRIPGRYLLTGSANPLLLPRLADSLAGRMEVLELMPLSQGEINNKEEHFIDAIFSTETLSLPAKLLEKNELYTLVARGGYPSVQQRTVEDQGAWMRNYLNLLLQKDIKDLAQIEKITELPNLLKISGTRASSLLNVASMANEIRMVPKTAHRYLNLLEAIFILYLQTSWNNNRSLRISKSPKLYFIDTGLLCYLLDIGVERISNDGFFVGQLIENFVVSELKKQQGWNKTEVKLFHFRNSQGLEVDTILENRSGQIIGIEIKNSHSISHDDFKGLKYLRDRTDKFLKGIVLYNGSQIIPFGNNLFAVPISCIWQ